MSLSKTVNKAINSKNAIQNQALRVMSFNIHLKDCESDIPEDFCWKKRRQNVASVIKFHNMDIIGLQEPTKDQVMDLVNILPEYEWYGAMNNEGPIEAILYLKTRLQLLDSSYFFLSPTPETESKGWNAKFIRGVTWVKFKDLKSKSIFYFFNTHFDYHSKLARNKSAQLLREKIEQITQNESFIVTGDFNIFPTLGGDETYKILTRDNYLIDAQVNPESNPIIYLLIKK